MIGSSRATPGIRAPIEELVMAGFGGQGVMVIGKILAYAAM